MPQQPVDVSQPSQNVPTMRRARLEDFLDCDVDDVSAHNEWLTKKSRCVYAILDSHTPLNTNHTTVATAVFLEFHLVS